MEGLPNSNNTNTSLEKPLSQEARKSATILFINFLIDGKKNFEQKYGVLRKHMGDESLEKNKSFLIFRDAVDALSKESILPSKEQMSLRMGGHLLNPADFNEMAPGVTGYLYGSQVVTTTLKEILEPEAFDSLKDHLNEILVSPLEDSIERLRQLL